MESFLSFARSGHVGCATAPAKMDFMCHITDFLLAKVSSHISLFFPQDCLQGYLLQQVLDKTGKQFKKCKVLLHFNERFQTPLGEPTELCSPLLAISLLFPQQHHLMHILAVQMGMTQ